MASLVESPYWWRDTAPQAICDRLPEGSVDVAVVGAGYCGLFTALHLARGGLRVAVFDADAIGEHASSRNFGAIGRTIRLSFSQLLKRDGPETALRVYEEAKAWVEFTAAFIERENLDCRFYRNGRIVAAHCPAAYDSAARELEIMQRHMDVDTCMLAAGQTAGELGSTVYHGATLLRDVGHLDPGRYLQAILSLVRREGVTLHANHRVTNVTRQAKHFSLMSNHGEVRAEQVVLTSNAETGTDNPLFRYFRRRVLPINAYTVVSEPLTDAVFDSVFPKRRTMLESRRLYLALRPIEPENRLLAVGRHMREFASLAEAAAEIKKDMVIRYPQLADCRFSHVWRGRFCVTFDWMPHFGTHEGVHYLLGLNGAGVPASGYLAAKLAQKILGRPNQESVFADRPFPGKLGYTGSGWFLPAVAPLMRYWDRKEAQLPR